MTGHPHQHLSSVMILLLSLIIVEMQFQIFLLTDSNHSDAFITFTE